MDHGWQPGVRYPGQASTKLPDEDTFRTSSLRIPGFSDTSDCNPQRKSPRHYVEAFTGTALNEF